MNASWIWLGGGGNQRLITCTLVAVGSGVARVTVTFVGSGVDLTVAVYTGIGVAYI